MGAAVSLLSLLAELHALLRRYRCVHRMVPMSDGPICSWCGRAWIWEA